MARAATLFASVFIGLACVATHAVADDRAQMDDPFEITADRIDFDDARGLYVAKGHVRVDHGLRRLRAGWVAFSKQTRIGVAEGDVQLEDGPDQLRASFMVFDVDTLQGMLFQGSLDAGGDGFMVRAKELVRTGANTFTAEDGRFTTCRCEPGERLPWEIHAANADVELGGYGTLTNSTFDVLGVPVLWIPWAFFPVKSERETGLLLPSFAFGGRGGAEVALPFFWAALPQLNVTLTPHYFTQRGYKQDVELEYVFGERSGGSLFVAGLRDEQFVKGVSNFNRDRWAVLWDHDQDLPMRWRWQTDLNLSSDNQYSDDFIELRRYSAYRFIESTSNVARDFGASGGYGAMVAARYAEDVQGATVTDRDQLLLQRFTEVRGDVQPGALAGPFGIETRIDSELIYFSGLRTTQDELAQVSPGGPGPLRNNGRFYDYGYNGIFDGPPPANGEDNGVFDPGEPLDERGARLLLHPRVARAFQFGNVVEFVPEVGWQQALYRTNTEQFAERGLLTARADLRGRIAREYFDQSGGAVRHILEPRLGWAFVSSRQQRHNPLFVPEGTVEQTRLRNLSLENVTRSPSDRIDNANQIVLALGQRFFARDRRGQGPRLLGDLVTALDWDFANGGGLGDLSFEARLFPRHGVGGRVRGAFNPEDAAFKEGEVGLDLGLPISGRVFRAINLGSSYRYRSELPNFTESVSGNLSDQGAGDSKLNQIDWQASLELTARIRLSYQGVYSFVDGTGFLQNRGLVEYVSKCRCWGVGVSVQHERDQGFGGGLEIRFLGLGDDASNLFEGGLGTGFHL